MSSSLNSDHRPGRHGPREPADWVVRFAPLNRMEGTVLDLAAGSGRHARFLLRLGYRVTALDRDVSGLRDLAGNPRAEVFGVDLEDGTPVLTEGGVIAGRTFAGIVVTDYLHRPLVPHLLGAVAVGGVLIYETFAAGNQRFGRPRNPDHLLEQGELLEWVRGRFHVVAYEHGLLDRDGRPTVKQRLVAVNHGSTT